MRKKCIILVDGSNFYFKLKDLKLHKEPNFNFSGFARRLVNKGELIRATYYVGAVRTDGTPHTQKLYIGQRRLLGNLRKHGFLYSLGYLMRSNDKMHEKGVDVNIAVDMLVATYENLCDRIILVSSDTDLLPAIKKAKEKGKVVEYVGFSHQPSLAMIANCSESTLLKKEDLLPFVETKKRV
ncbi:MAG: NYN domain-containing protein [bacterium]|nr:NYN domain-containing protein [bacterium]